MALRPDVCQAQKGAQAGVPVLLGAKGGEGVDRGGEACGNSSVAEAK